MDEPGSVSDELLDELASIADRAAAAAVDLIHTGRPSALTVEAKSTSTDMVTQMDTASERLIRSIITEARPDDLVVGEEGGSVGPESGASDPNQVTWWVDPIDGTTNYVYDHPGYNVSIAAGVGEVTLVAVVADPTHGRTYSAVLGRGAFCDDRRLRLGEAAGVEGSLVATGFAYDAGRRGRQGEVVARVLPQVRDIRRMGAAAMDLCSVASGRVDAYYEAGLSIWDLAAGALIATEAGARLGSLDGGQVRPECVLAAHPDRFEELRGLLLEAGADRV